MKELFRLKINSNNFPALTEEQKDQLLVLANKKDHEIDYSDIPEIKDEEFDRARLYKPVKKATTIRLDADVLLWFKSKGKGYQTKINAILRDVMVSSKWSSDNSK